MSDARERVEAVLWEYGSTGEMGPQATYEHLHDRLKKALTAAARLCEEPKDYNAYGEWTRATSIIETELRPALEALGIEP